MAEKTLTGMIVRAALWLGLAAAAVAGAMAYSMREVPMKVTVATVTRGPVTETVAAITTGSVTAPLASKVSAAGVGTVSAVHVNEGDAVPEGGLLMELNHAELDAQVALAQANLSVGESRASQARIAAQTAREISEIELRRASSALEMAQSDFNRIKALTEKQAISQSDYDKASLALKTAQDARAAAEAMRDKAFVRAPFAGVVAKKLLQVGEAVVMGMPVAYLVQAGGAYIEAPFDEANLEALKVGQTAEIEIDSCPGRTFKGTLTYISPVVTMMEQLSRSLLCKISIDEGAEMFRPGMSADVTIITDRKEDVPFVPSEALVRDKYAFVVRDGRAEQREVETGIGNWDQREILGGLAVGDTIITSISVKGLADGSKIEIVEALDD